MSKYTCKDCKWYENGDCHNLPPRFRLADNQRPFVDSSDMACSVFLPTFPMTCETCRFWFISSTSSGLKSTYVYGECRFFPPVAILEQFDQDLYKGKIIGSHPCTASDHVCGHWSW
jgi:hypothetical protein